MPDSLAFAVDVFNTVCDRLRTKVADLPHLIEDGYSFEEWLNWEAFLACKHRQDDYPYCEVTSKPSYASENVSTEAGKPDPNYGDLRVGGPNDGADHCWLFAEIALLHDGTQNKWLKKIEYDVEKLLRLGWKKSASLLVVVVASRTDVLTVWAADLEQFELWNRPALTDPYTIALPDGGTVIVKAFDIKQNPADTLCLKISAPVP